MSLTLLQGCDKGGAEGPPTPISRLERRAEDGVAPISMGAGHLEASIYELSSQWTSISAGMIDSSWMPRSARASILELSLNKTAFPVWTNPRIV